MLRFLSLFKKASPVRLGRWSHQQTKATVDLKVDWANHDCCGGPLCTNVPLKAPERKERNCIDEPSDVAMYALGSWARPNRAGPFFDAYCPASTS